MDGSATSMRANWVRKLHRAVVEDFDGACSIVPCPHGSGHQEPQPATGPDRPAPGPPDSSPRSSRERTGATIRTRIGKRRLTVLFPEEADRRDRRTPAS